MLLLLPLFNTVSFAGEYAAAVTGWELSSCQIPNAADPSLSLVGVEIIDSEADAYEGRGALHLWANDTKGNGYIACASTAVEEFEAGKTYRFQGMIKTSQAAWGKPALTLGNTNIATNLAQGLTADQWCAFSKDFAFSGNSKEFKIQMWSIGNVYLDNISLKEVTASGLGEELLENVDFEKDYTRVYGAPIAIKDDYENIIVGATFEMEYSTDGGSTWQAYDENNIPHFSGNISVLLKYTDDPNKDSHILQLNFVENAIAGGDFEVSEFRILKNEFFVHGTLKNAKNEGINILLVREGKPISGTENIILIKSFKTDETGKFSLTAQISDYREGMSTPNDGWYTMYLRSKGTEIHKFDKVYFASSGSINAALGLLKSGNTSAYFDENNEYFKVYGAMGFAFSEYAKPGVNKTKAVQIFESNVSALGDSLDEDSASAEFAKAVLLAATGSKNATSLYEILYERCKDFPLVYSDDVDLEAVLSNADVMAWVSSYFAANTAEDFATAQQLFKEAYSLYLINHATYGKVAELIKAQSTFLNLDTNEDYSEYMQLHNVGDNKAITVSKYIVSECAKAPFTDRKMLLKAIKDGLEKSKEGTTLPGSPEVSHSASSSSVSSRAASGGGSAGNGMVMHHTTDVKTAYFSDLSGYSWAENAINVLFEKGIISGKSAGRFAPQDTITRQEFVKMIVSLTDTYDETAECDFDDVDKNAWYYKYVASAVKSGLIFGISDTGFGTDSAITREQIAVIANRIQNKTIDAEKITYVDDSEVGEYAKEAVYNIRKLGIMSGYEDGTFGPKNSATRAEAAVICLNLLNKR